MRAAQDEAHRLEEEMRRVRAIEAEANRKVELAKTVAKQYVSRRDLGREADEC